MGAQVVSVSTATLRGIEAIPVEVEVGTSQGIPGLSIVGMPDSAILEARSRIRCALKACDFHLPRLLVTVNLAPGEIRKTGTGFDLPIAVAILIATGQVSPEVARNHLFVGELALDGRVCPVRGEVAYAICAQRRGLGLVTSAEAHVPASYGRENLALSSLSQLRHGLDGLPALGEGRKPADQQRIVLPDEALDYGDVVDQELAKRAMVIAAAGGHGMLMIGPPGAGKTMLAKRMVTILPPLGPAEAAQTMLIHSVAGQPLESLAGGMRPFRAPHHSISTGGLVGGGRPVLPGEVSLAHRGILFLDELPEFQKSALQALRQPLEDHEVRIVRVDGAYVFPCDFQLVAAANPCPCGHYMDPGKACKCPEPKVIAYQSKIGGPLLDRIDVVCDVARPSTEKVIQGRRGLTSEQMREMVEQAREFRAARRARGDSSAGSVGAARFDAKALALFEGYAKRLGLGGRAIVRLSRVARTVADVNEHQNVTCDDLMEATAFRSRSLV